MKYAKEISVAAMSMSLFTAMAATPKSQELDIVLKRASVQQISNVVYAQATARGYDNVALRMDILKPAAPKPLPAVVFVTGGGFINANKDSAVLERLDLAEAGYVVASVEYRVAPTVQFPAPLLDVKSAIRYLRANAARFNIDPKRIAIFGESAGGYLSAMTGVTNEVKTFDQGDNLDQSSTVQAVVDLYGLSDLSRVGEGFAPDIVARHASPAAPEAMWLNGPGVFFEGGPVTKDPAKLAAANPLTYASKNAPPFLLMHGDKDTVVSPRQTEILHEALIATGADSTRYLVHGAAHGGQYWVQPEVMKIIIRFLDSHLK